MVWRRRALAWPVLAALAGIRPIRDHAVADAIGVALEGSGAAICEAFLVRLPIGQRQVVSVRSSSPQPARSLLGVEMRGAGIGRRKSGRARGTRPSERSCGARQALFAWWPPPRGRFRLAPMARRIPAASTWPMYLAEHRAAQIPPPNSCAITRALAPSAHRRRSSATLAALRRSGCERASPPARPLERARPAPSRHLVWFRIRRAARLTGETGSAPVRRCRGGNGATDELGTSVGADGLIDTAFGHSPLGTALAGRAAAHPPSAPCGRAHRSGRSADAGTAPPVKRCTASAIAGEPSRGAWPC